MIDRDTPITSIDEARAYFEAMGCSHFHMSRENFTRYDEYKALKIGKELEEEWRTEQFEAALEDLSDETSKTELWLRHSRTVDLYGGIGSQKRRKMNFPRVIDATYKIESRMTSFDRILVSETVLGRATYRDDGLVCEAHDLKRRDIAEGLHSFVERLLDFAEFDQELNERRMAAIALNEELKVSPPKPLIPGWLERIVGR